MAERGKHLTTELKLRFCFAQICGLTRNVRCAIVIDTEVGDTDL